MVIDITRTQLQQLMMSSMMLMTALITDAVSERRQGHYFVESRLPRSISVVIMLAEYSRVRV